jgi:addiction module toxin, RelE/StbE family
VKTAIKSDYDVSLLDNIIGLLIKGRELPEKNKDHALSGNWIGHRECHITPDWFLVYKVDKDILILLLTGTGRHSDLF